MRFLVAESEPPAAREKRRASVGRSSGETVRDLLLSLSPGAAIDRATPADADGDIPDEATIAGYDAVFLTGSPLHVYDDTPEAAAPQGGDSPPCFHDVFRVLEAAPQGGDGPPCITCVFHSFCFVVCFPCVRFVRACLPAPTACSL